MIRQKTIRVTLLPPSELEAIQQEALEFAGIGLYRYRFDGTILFAEPKDPALVAAIEAELAK